MILDHRQCFGVAIVAELQNPAPIASDDRSGLPYGAPEGKGEISHYRHHEVRPARQRHCP
ncbi:hypothetical protein [Sphingomonas cavernae]|uniref:hypothetical protein n=1 Tax=Sphingomonas cavernae TaxID=2320861 RepID=UPI001EE593E0|nr:hypothetical protein [Sphingomonas cavernae]